MLKQINNIQYNLYFLYFSENINKNNFDDMLLKS